MKRTIILTALLIMGLVLSQAIPAKFGELATWLTSLQAFLTMGLLAYIMIQVGREFEIDLKNKKQYAVDYGVAATAAAFPWIFCSLYFLVFLMPEGNISGRSVWIDALLAGRFAAPTSAGVLFSMLSATGLAGTWTFQKARSLAIFDDLDTVLFMIPLKVLMVGLAWQLGVELGLIILLIIGGIKFYRKANWPTSWPWILLYSFIMTGISEIIYFYSKDPVNNMGVHIEVLLPAFLLGCILKAHNNEEVAIPGEDLQGSGPEERAGLFISCVFMLLVGLSMPSAFGENASIKIDMGVGEIIIHVLLITVISNIGKMFAAFCYRKEASLRERLAVSVAMFPRGEVGAGVLAVALSYGIQGSFITIGFLSLAINLILTGFFIFIVKKLIDPVHEKKEFNYQLGLK